MSPEGPAAGATRGGVHRAELRSPFNLADHLLGERLVEGAGERVALRLDAGEWTYGQVAELADRFGQVLAGLGVRQEERVLIALPDGPEYVGALFGVLRIGAVAVMINPALERDRLEALVAYCRPGAAVADPAVAAELAAARRPPWPRTILTVGGELPGHPSFEREAAGVAGVLETAPTHPDDPAIWLFSGGTTGRPKAVVQTHRSFANTTELYARRAVGYRADDVTLSVPKLFFGYATGSNLFFPFSVGASAVLFPERPTPDRLFGLIERHRPTILVNVPTMIQRMVSHADAEAADLSSLRFATSAGEALPEALYRRWRERFGVELLDGLGTAEMWHIFLSNLPDAVRPGTLGRVVPGFEVRVRDDAGRDLPDGEVGRLWVRGDSRALGYWQDARRTAEAFRGEWFVGGDLVRRDRDGYVTYCGRDDDVMKVSGKWLAPAEVEGCLLGHPAVEECAVVGVTDEGGLTKPWAWVVTDGDGEGGGADEEGLKGWVLERLEPYKHPRRVLLVDELPRTHLGKVDRGALKRRGEELAAGA